MANERAVGSDELQLEFLFVPHGDPEPVEWMARHPGWVKFPAVFVPRAGRRPSEASRPPPWPRLAENTAASVSSASEMANGAENTAAIPSDPVTAYLGVNDTLEHLGLGHSGGRSNPASSQIAASYAPDGAAGTSAEQSGVLHGAAKRPAHLGKPEDPTAPVPLVDDRGRPILKHGKPVLRPAGLDPHFFVEQGLKDRKIETELLRTGEAGGPAELGYEIGKLSNFKWWGAWDAQRVGGRNHPEYVDYATIAIGLYAAAAGIPRDMILAIQNTAAGVGSHFGPRKKHDGIYTHLLHRNVENTDIGYELYKSGRIKPECESGGRNMGHPEDE